MKESNERLVEITIKVWDRDDEFKIHHYKVIPHIFYFGSTNQHPDVQWLMSSTDESGDERTFAMKNIVEWRRE